jgi:ATP-binding cassette, subfamily B, bacterial
LRDVIVSSVFENFRILTTGFILLFTGAAMTQGTFSVGDLVFFIALLFPLGDFTVQLSRQLAIYQQLKVSHERLRELLPEAEADRLADFVPSYLKSDPPRPAAITRSPGDRLETLEVRGLSSAMKGQVGVAGIDLMLRRGTFTAVAGRVGAGKTTLLKSLLGISPRTAGDILWNGRPVKSLRRHFEPPRASYVSQAPVLFSDTLRQDILLGRESVARNIDELIREAELGPDIAELTHGLDTEIGAFGVRLSGGQAQRVAFARALAHDPELLVLDDLASGLDSETEEQIWRRLSDGSDRRTCLFVTHRRVGLRRADHIVVLKEGSKIAEGTLSELLQSCDELKAIWDTEVDDTARA